MTTSIGILASSRSLVDGEILKRKGYDSSNYLYLEQLEEYYYDKVKHLFTMPYLYESEGGFGDYFYDYLQNRMELGDTIELFEILDPEKDDELLKGIHLFPYAIQINIHDLTYQNEYGTFLLNKKNWVEDLKHRPLIVPDGITVIRNY